MKKIAVCILGISLVGAFELPDNELFKCNFGNIDVASQDKATVFL